MSKEKNNIIMLNSTRIQSITIDGEQYINRNYEEDTSQNELTILKLFFDDIAESLFHVNFTKLVK